MSLAYCHLNSGIARLFYNFFVPQGATAQCGGTGHVTKATAFAIALALADVRKYICDIIVVEQGRVLPGGLTAVTFFEFSRQLRCDLEDVGLAPVADFELRLWLAFKAPEKGYYTRDGEVLSRYDRVRDLIQPTIRVARSRGHNPGWDIIQLDGNTNWVRFRRFCHGPWYTWEEFVASPEYQTPPPFPTIRHSDGKATFQDGVWNTSPLDYFEDRACTKPLSREEGERRQRLASAWCDDARGCIMF